MVLEGIVKYLIATILLFFSLFMGWLISARYLEPVILKVFTPKTHEEHLDIWFLAFVLRETLIILGYVTYAYRTYKSKNKING
jgi:hypothetical protein